MNPLFYARDCFARTFEKKWIPVLLFSLFLLFCILGIVLVGTPAFYDYHLDLCDRFLDRVCYSSRSVVLIFFERAAGSSLLVVLVSTGGIHPAALLLPSVTIAYRAYTFGGTLAILFSVYRAAGALVAFALYLPIHLLLDAVLLAAASLAFHRAFRFRMRSWREFFSDLLVLCAAAVLICLLEMLLLGILFHPLGNLL